MRFYFEYACDEGHRWEDFGERDALDSEASVACPYGHEAVTVRKSPVPDVVEVSIRPAVRICDAVTRQISLSRKYYLVVRSMQSGFEKATTRRLTFQQSIDAVRLFQNEHSGGGDTVSPEVAWRLVDEIDSGQAGGPPTNGATSSRR